MRLFTELDPMRKNLEPWIEDTAYKMGHSAFSVSIWTDNFATGIDSLLQFALSMVLDKPIFLLVPNGIVVPENVRKVAVAIEFCDFNDKASMHVAMDRLMKIAKEKIPSLGGGTTI